MSLLCFLGRHQPSTTSIARGRDGGYTALCDGCGVPLERADNGRWQAAQPLVRRADR